MEDTIYIKFLQNIKNINFFEDSPKVLVACSGGVDSTALMLLTKKWIDFVKGELFVATVDHNLRANSKAEAKVVENLCNLLKIKHYTLEWKHNEDVSSNIQEKARNARYKLLTELCQKKDILNLFTGHHQDDQLENFFIRLSRKSGGLGLVDQKTSFIKNTRICKPLYNFKKTECAEYLFYRSIPFVEDESNKEEKYFRNEIRAKLKLFFTFKNIENNLFRDNIIASQDNLIDVAKISQESFIAMFSQAANISQNGYVIVELNYLSKYNNNLRYMLLQYILIIVSGYNTIPRFKKLSLLLEQIFKEDFKSSTLHNCVVAKIDKSTLLFYKEAVKIGAKVEGGYSIKTEVLFWDNRFKVYNNSSYTDLYIGQITFNEYKNIKNKINLDKIKDTKNHKFKVLFTFPVIKRLEKIIAIPNINYYEEKLNIKVVFEPQFNLKTLHTLIT